MAFYVFMLFFLSVGLSGCFLQTNISSLNSIGLESISSNPVTFTVELSKPVVTKTASDQTENSFVTISMSQAQESAVTFTLSPISADATSLDFELETTTITFAPGETSKQVKLIVKGRVGSQDWEKQVTLKVSPDSSRFSQTEVSKDFTIKDSNSLVLTVNPFYATLGSQWNTYIQGNIRMRVISRYLRIRPEELPNETACTITGACIHAGELKKVVVSNRKSCAGISMQDSEDVFEWRCSASTAPAYFYSLGFKSGKGLKDLLLGDGTDWKTIRVNLVEGGQTIASSSLARWWNNTVSLYDSTNINSGGAAARITLSQSETIFVIKGNLQSRGINIDGDGIALVTLPGSSLSGTATLSSVDCDTSDVPVDNCFINNMLRDRIWIEGTYIGASGLPVISNQTFMNVMDNFRLHASRISGGSAGIFNYSTAGDVYSDSTFIGGAYGIYNGSSQLASYFDLKFYGQTNTALDPGNTSTYPKLLNFQISNTVGAGIYLWGQQLVGSQIQINGVQGHGISGFAVYANLNNVSITNSTSNGFHGLNTMPTIFNMTSFGNAGYGLYLKRGIDQVVSQVLSINNAVGVGAEGTAGTSTIQFHDLGSLDNSTSEIEFQNNASRFTFKNKLFLGRSTTKCVFGTGISSINVTGANCDPASGDPLVTTVGADANTVLQGFVNDSLNSQGANGAAGTLFSNVTDWFNFTSFSRSWVPWTASAIPNATVRARCTSGSCGIYDVAIKAGTHGFKNYNGTFVANGACPAITKGTNAMTYSSMPANIGLQGAAEFMLDAIGDDDGICETNETCYFLPDLGANFFDLTSLSQTCVYDADGSALTGITIYGKP